MTFIRTLLSIFVAAVAVSSCCAAELQCGRWKVQYDANGLKALSYDDIVWLANSSFTVFRPGYKQTWFTMAGAAVNAHTTPQDATITWTRQTSQCDARLELQITSERATWRGRWHVGVEGPVEMILHVPPARMASSPGEIRICSPGRDTALAIEQPMAGLTLAHPIQFESPEWTVLLEGKSSARPWLVQDRRQAKDPAIRLVVCDRGSEKATAGTEVALSLRPTHHANAELAGRKALLAQSMRRETPLPVVNPGFEAGDKPEGWHGGRNAVVETGKAVEGQHCLRLTISDPSAGGYYVTQRVPVEPGARYRLSGMIKQEGVKPADVGRMASVGCTLIIEWADKDGKWLAAGAYSHEAGFGTHDWQRAECREVLAPEKARYAIVYLALRGVGTAWFDDIRLVECRPAVVLRSPLDGARMNDNRPLLHWRDDPDAQSYRVEIGRDAALQPDKLWASARCVDNEFRPDKPLPPGTWYWRVRRDDGYGSAVWSFVQSASADADTTGPEISMEPVGLEKPDQGFPARVADRSGVNWDAVEVQVDGTTTPAIVDRTATGISLRPRGGWKRGAHRVTVATQDRLGNRESRAAWMAVVPPPPNKITWTQDRGVLIGQQHRLALGIFQVSEPDMAKVKQAGFDYVHNYQWEGSQDDAAARAYLDAAHRHGLTAFVGFDRGGQSSSGLRQMNLEHVTRRIAALRDHPALLAWYLFDEPDLPHQYIPPRKLQLLYQHIARLDPYHPVIVTLANAKTTADYPRCYDVYWSQVYRTTAQLDQKLRQDRAAIGNAPLMAIVHCYDPRQTRLMRAGVPADDAAFQPALRWLRANAFTALANGSSGLCWWWYGDHRRQFLSAGDVPQAWDWLGQVVRELRQLEPILTAGGQAIEVHVSPSDAPLRVWARLTGRQLTIIAANYAEQTIEATLTASSLPSSGQARLQFDNRTIPIRDGKLVDTFAPLQPHVYRIDLP